MKDVQWAANLLSQYSDKEPHEHESDIRQVIESLYEYEIEVGYGEGFCVEMLEPRNYRIFVDVSYMMNYKGKNSSCDTAPQVL